MNLHNKKYAAGDLTLLIDGIKIFKTEEHKMKNKTLMKTLSALLSVIMVLCSAPLSGFVGLKFPGIKLPEWNLFDFSVLAEAKTYSGTCGENITWSLDSETGVLDITGTGDMPYFSSSESAPWSLYRLLAKTVNISDGITSIDNYAFYDFANLVDVNIPESVTNIGSYVFYDCTSLTAVTIPDSVTSMGNYVFWECTSLTSVTIGNSVTSIGDSAFKYCDSLKSVIIGSSVTSIGNCAFSFCKRLTTVTIPDNVTNIGYEAFYNCTRLTTVAIPDSVTSIGDSTFEDCTSLTTVTIPDSVTSIGDSAFFCCDSLTTVTIPDGVTSIGGDAFKDCTSLANVYYTGDTESWCGITFDGYSANPMYYAMNFYIDNALVKEIVIPDTVAEIKPYTFCGFEGVISVTIGDGVTSIGDGAFYNCTNLAHVYSSSDTEAWCGITFGDNYANPMYYAKNFYIDNTLVKEIVIPDTVTEIKPYAFCGFEGVTSVTIGDSVTSIGDGAFYNCTNLARVYCTSDTESWCRITFGSYSANPMYYAKDFYIDNTLVKEIVIPDTVTEIKPYVFCGFEGVTSVTIHNSVTSIGQYVFKDCTSLTSVTIGNSVMRIGYRVFHNCTSLVNVYYTGDTESWCGITFGDDYANPLYYAENFYIDNALVKEFVIPDTVTEIKDYAFCGFEGLDSVTIPDGVTSIGKYAFYNCESLTLVTIPDSIESLGSYAFCNCGSLVSVTIPDSVTSIGYSAFYNCTNLTSVTISDSVTSIGGSAFYNCTGLKELTMPVSANIYNSQHAFMNCTNIEKVTLTKGTGTMQNYGTSTSSSATYTYYQCTPWYESRSKIKEIVIEDGVTNIGACAFMDCTGLVTLTIPSEVIVVRENAFYGCEAIGKVYFLGTEEEWNEVVIREGNDPILNAKKVFIPAGHEHQYDEFVSVEPTCIEDGVKTFTCSCGDSYTEKIPATGHGERIVASEIPPTCTETGMRYYKCSVCGFDGEDEIVYSTSECPQSSHDYSNYENDTKTFSSPGAKKLILKFSSQTQVENRYDYIYIYNGDGSLYGEYTGTSLKGKTIELEGDSFSIKLASDVIGVYYGYSFDSITAIVTPGKEYCEEIPATGHVKIVASETPPTCTETGMRYYKCSVCGLDGKNEIVYSTSECPQSSHNYSNNAKFTKTFLSPGAKNLILKFSSQTKVENGYDYIYIYNGDGSLYGKYTGTSLSGRTIELEEDSFSISLTSNDIGTYYGYSFDSITAVIADAPDYSYQEVIPATGHTEGEAVEENRIGVTCIDGGSYDTVIYCTTCEAEISRETTKLPATGHASAEAVEENRVEPECKRRGSYDSVVYCEVCGIELSRENIKIPALGHKPGEAKEENRKEPTCTTDGAFDTVVYCTVCEKEVSRETTILEAVGHTESEAVEENRVEETCTESGTYDTVVYCSVCGEEISRETKSIPAKGHNFGGWVVTIEPTMTTDGVKVRECLACDETEEGVAPKTGITITLTDSEGKVISETVVEGNVTDYSFSDLADGKYTVTVSKETCVSREYTITAEDGKASCEFKFNHVGDVNGDGKVNAIDVARANASAKGVNALTGYDLACSDVNGDGKVNMIDVALMNAHSKGVSVLW